MITINSNQPPQQPTGLNENPERVQTDTLAIDGSIQRNQADSKKRAELSYQYAKPSTVRFFEALYQDAAAVEYHNDQSNHKNGQLSFTGLIDVEHGDYEKGGTLGIPITVTIREV